MKVRFGIPSLLAISTLILSACSTTPRAGVQADTATAQATPEIQIDGSSTVYPLTDAIAKAFQQKQPDASVAVAFSGTTSGFRKFCAGETDINNASRPISTEEIAACRQAGVRFVEIPVAFDALTVVVNPRNTWAQSLTVEELKKMWEPAAEGTVKTWNQIRPDFPNRPLTLHGAGGESGTYDYFAEVIAGDRNTRSDYSGSEDDNDTVKAVSSDPNALGYFGFAYFEEKSGQAQSGSDR